MRNAHTERLPPALIAQDWRLPVQLLETLAGVLDCVLIISVSAFASAGFHWVFHGSPANLEEAFGLGTVVAALLVPRKWLRGHYRPMELLDSRRQIRRLIVEWLFISVLLAGIAFALKASAIFSRGATFSFAALGLLALIFARLAWQNALKRALMTGLLRGKRVALISPGDMSEIDTRVLALGDYGYEIVASFAPPAGELNDRETWRTFLSSINNEVCGSGVEEILICLDWNRARTLISALEKLRVIPLPVHVIPDLETACLLMKPARRLGSTVAIEVQRAPLRIAERALKRSIDLILSATSLILVLPLLLAVAAAIKLDTAGPVLFRQTRRGFNGQPFTILKFRSMTVMDDGVVIVQARRSDPRVTRVGRFLRRSSLDELPQLINVLRGEMSIVGPRPHAMAHDSYYDKLIANYALRHHVKPGLTGWAQIHGYRGETPRVELMSRRVELDLWYVDNWTLWLDLRIMFRTCRELVRTSNAY